MALNGHQKSIGITDDWITPIEILKHLGVFDLDPSASINQPWATAKSHFTIKDDGLKKEWTGRIWLNPPFNRYDRPLWMKKMSEHNNGIMLIPAACETKPFQKFVFGKATGILMLNHRPVFCFPNGQKANGNAGATICLISYGKENLKALKESNLGTVLIEPCN